MAMMQIAPGYQIEPFATEPSVVSPVAMDIDEDGRIYVVEDRAYPLDVNGKVGRVKLLEDTNGDGKPDRTTVFAENLVMPTGVMRWKKGILVTDPPDVWYLEDTDGDGKADVRKKVLTGFAFTNPQHTANGPVYGLDNWIYMAHENAGYSVIFQERVRRPRFRYSFRRGAASCVKGARPQHPHSSRTPSSSRPYPVSSQFGHAFDDFGRHFVLNNTYHARHEVIAARYINRNPDLPVASTTEDISDHGMPAKVYPIVDKTRFEMLTNVGEFTSACGLTLWRGGAFVAEPAHNLVHRDVYSASGATFKASRDRDQIEFLASRDPWFRPVNFYAAPDGSLYMLDFYRLVIEHPEWMSTEAFHATKDLTRRHRSRAHLPNHTGQLRHLPIRLDLSAASTSRVREISGKRKPVVETNRATASGGSQKRSTQRRRWLRWLRTSFAGRTVHALWTLDGLSKLEIAVHRQGARVIRLLACARTAFSWPNPACGEMDGPAAPARDGEAIGRQSPVPTALHAGFRVDPGCAGARDRLLTSNFNDRWMQIAALSASPDEANRLFRSQSIALPRLPSFGQVATVIGARRRPAEMQSILRLLTTGSGAEWRAATLEGLARGMRGKDHLSSG